MFITYTVSFFGHRHIDYFFKYEDKLYTLVHKLISKNQYVDFLVGRDGDFDQLASSVVHRAKRDLGAERCGLTWVMPYQKAEYYKNAEAFDKYYDSVEVCAKSAKSHYKSAIQIRNKSMVDCSDFVVFFVEHNYGGAYQTMKYAKKHGKKIINIAEKDFVQG